MPQINNNRFTVYQLKNQKLAGLEYADLKKKGKEEGKKVPNIDDYEQMYMAGLNDDDTINKVISLFIKFPPKEFPGKPLNVSDIVVMIVDGCSTAWYINRIEKDGSFKAVLVPNFIKDDGRFIMNDDKEYVIKGKNGKWKVVKEYLVHNIPFYEMQNCEDARVLHILLTFDGRVIAENLQKVENDELARAQSFLKKNYKYYQRGTYVNLKDIPEEKEAEKEKDPNQKLSLDERILKGKEVEEQERLDEQKKRREEMDARRKETQAKRDMEREQAREQERLKQQQNADAADQFRQSQQTQSSQMGNAHNNPLNNGDNENNSSEDKFVARNSRPSERQQGDNPLLSSLTHMSQDNPPMNNANGNMNNGMNPNANNGMNINANNNNTHSANNAPNDVRTNSENAMIVRWLQDISNKFENMDKRMGLIEEKLNITKDIK